MNTLTKSKLNNWQIITQFRIRSHTGGHCSFWIYSGQMMSRTGGVAFTSAESSSLWQNKPLSTNWSSISIFNISMATTLTIGWRMICLRWKYDHNNENFISFKTQLIWFGTLQQLMKLSLLLLAENFPQFAFSISVCDLGVIVVKSNYTTLYFYWKEGSD